MDERAVLKERRVERSESVLFGADVTAQMLFRKCRVGNKRRGKAAGFHTRWQRANRGELLHKMSVHEDQPCAGEFGERELTQGLGSDSVRARIEDRLEGQLRDRRDVREAPVLVLHRRKAEFGKAREARLAEREDPRRVPARGWRNEFVKLRQMRVGFFYGLD